LFFKWQALLLYLPGGGGLPGDFHFQDPVGALSGKIMRTATEHLIQEHEKILSMLKILERICSLLKENAQPPSDHLEELLRFFEIFADRIHHGKEEEILLPALLEKGFPLPGGPLCTYFKGLQMMGPSLQGQIHEVEALLNREGKSTQEKLNSPRILAEGTIPVLEEHRLARLLVRGMRQELGQPRFADFATRFIRLLYEHIDKENRCLFPMADECLTEERQTRLVEEFEGIDRRFFGTEEFNVLESKWERLKKIYLTPPPPI
jgi:hemerythrin-like domain-containing protein